MVLQNQKISLIKKKKKILDIRHDEIIFRSGKPKWPNDLNHGEDLPEN